MTFNLYYIYGFFSLSHKGKLTFCSGFEILLPFTYLMSGNCIGEAGHNVDDDPFVGGKHAWNEVRVDMRLISFMGMGIDVEIGRHCRNNCRNN